MIGCRRVPAASFVNHQQDGVSVRGVTRRAFRLLQQHPWRGNVRKLETILEQAVIFRRGE